MSLLGAGGGRRIARTAAVTAGTLLVWLVVTAIPASALVSCAQSGSGSDMTLTFNMTTDEKLTLGVADAGGPFPDGNAAAGTIMWTVQNPATGNYGAFANTTVAPCGTAVPATTSNTGWVHVNGSNAGSETLTLFRPGFFSGFADTVVTVDLGNGNDALEINYGGFTSPPYAAPFADPGFSDVFIAGTALDGTLVLDMTGGGVADGRVDDAENVTVSTGNGADLIDAGNSFGISAEDPIPAPQTGDDIPDAPDPWSASLTGIGGAGDDTLISGDGNDTFQGGPGDDLIDYTAASGPVDVNLGTGAASGMGTDTLVDVQDILGSDFGDTLTGSSLDNVIDGGDGDDTIDGGAGADILGGDADDDTFVEGAGANGSDTVDGDGGDDTVDLRGRTNALYIAPGVAASSGEGGCPLGAGCEDDTYTTDNEVYLLGSGADTFVGSAATAEWVMPGAGDDTVTGGAGGPDYLDLSDAAGPAVFDMITGTATGNGTDTFGGIEGFVGTAADDSVLSDDASGVPDDFIGGDGVDTVDASASTLGVTIDLSTYSSAPPDVENIIGGAGGDVLTGNALANSIWGNDGFDTIDAEAGNDFVEGGTGNDDLYGGVGGDTLSYVNSDVGMLIDTQLGFTEGIGGVGDGEDSLVAFEIVHGSDFGDEIIAGQTFFDPNNRLLGRGGDDTLIGSNSSDLLKGGGGNDYARAGGGDDVVTGGAGDDVLLGSSGDDLLRGGRGFDEGNGGRGADICRGIEDETSC